MLDLDIFFYGKACIESPIILKENKIGYYDLTIVTKGHLDYCIDHTDVHVNAGDGILIPPGSLRARTGQNEWVEYISFNFFSDSIKDYLSMGLHQKALTPNLILLLELYHSTHQNQRKNYKEECQNLLSLILLKFSDHEKRQQSNNTVVHIRDYIHQHLSEKITLEKISKETFLSPFYCDTLFKKETGQSLIQYATEQKMEYAKSLILQNQLSLTEIAEACGFQDYNYFSRVFKKQTGFSPKSFKG